jgi:hypothetical protein
MKRPKLSLRRRVRRLEARLVKVEWKLRQLRHGIKCGESSL